MTTEAEVEERPPVVTFIGTAEDNDAGAWLIMHTPRRQNGIRLCPGHNVESGPCPNCGKDKGDEDGCHAFGPFFGQDEVMLWINNSVDVCDLTVMPFVGVRPVVVGPLMPPPDPTDGKVH